MHLNVLIGELPIDYMVCKKTEETWYICIQDGSFGETTMVSTLVVEYKYLSWVYGVDRKICHEGH